MAFETFLLLISINLKRVDLVYNLDNYVLELKYRLQKTAEEAKQLLDKIKLRNKQYYDAKSSELNIKIGDKVLMKKETYNKLERKYQRSFTVLQLDLPNVVIKIEGKPQKMYANRIVLLNESN